MTIWKHWCKSCGTRTTAGDAGYCRAEECQSHGRLATYRNAGVLDFSKEQLLQSGGLSQAVYRRVKAWPFDMITGLQLQSMKDDLSYGFPSPMKKMSPAQADHAMREYVSEPKPYVYPGQLWEDVGRGIRVRIERVENDPQFSKYGEKLQTKGWAHGVCDRTRAAYRLSLTDGRLTYTSDWKLLENAPNEAKEKPADQLHFEETIRNTLKDAMSKGFIRQNALTGSMQHIETEIQNILQGFEGGPDTPANRDKLLRLVQKFFDDELPCTTAPPKVTVSGEKGAIRVDLSWDREVPPKPVGRAMHDAIPGSYVKVALGENYAIKDAERTSLDFKEVQNNILKLEDAVQPGKRWAVKDDRSKTVFTVLRVYFDGLVSLLPKVGGGIYVPKEELLTNWEPLA